MNCFKLFNLIAIFSSIACGKVNKDCNQNTYPNAATQQWYASHQGSLEESHGHFILSCQDGGFVQIGETVLDESLPIPAAFDRAVALLEQETLKPFPVTIVFAAPISSKPALVSGLSSKLDACASCLVSPVKIKRTLPSCNHVLCGACAEALVSAHGVRFSRACVACHPQYVQDGD